MVLGFEVADERSSAVRWIANLTVAYDPAAVRSRLLTVRAPYAETLSLPVLVVPIYESGVDVKRSRDTNQERAAWYELPPQVGLAPWVLPSGGLTTLTPLPPPQPLSNHTTT